MMEDPRIDKTTTLELLGNVLSHGVMNKIDQLEAVLITTDKYLTRFAKSQIHQHMAERNVDVAIRVVAGKKLGSVHLNSLELPRLEGAVEQAQKIARVQGENLDFVSLPSYDADRLPPVADIENLTYYNSTAVHSPEAKSNEIKELIDLTTTKKEEDLAGAYLTEISRVAIVNSLGVEVYMPTTLASLNVNITGPNGATGYAEFTSRDVKELNLKAVGKELKTRCRLSRNPKPLPAKTYPTIFEHYAVGELLIYLSGMGFSAKAVSEGWSFMCDKFNEKIVSPKISIWDDGLDARGLPIPFDFEGMPKQRVDLIEKGEAKGVVYDSLTAGREGKISTGHALPAPNPMGPQPVNLFMNIGESDISEMIEDTKEGILVTRIHYANPLDPKQTLLTGMTRDGTFLIEKGEITGAIKNMRFTQSLVEMLNTTKMVGNTSKSTRSWYGTCSVPCMKVGKFKFTGTTEH
ncbi:MAG: TldD/PmbA family protein [Thermoplasmata archaeon]|nr:MAG: TldD/PmbA family protein [Thermoplasmata archaeon]